MRERSPTAYLPLPAHLQQVRGEGDVCSRSSSQARQGGCEVKPQRYSPRGGLEGEGAQSCLDQGVEQREE